MLLDDPCPSHGVGSRPPPPFAFSQRRPSPAEGDNGVERLCTFDAVRRWPRPHRPAHVLYLHFCREIPTGRLAAHMSVHGAQWIFTCAIQESVTAALGLALESPSRKEISKQLCPPPRTVTRDKATVVDAPAGICWTEPAQPELSKPSSNPGRLWDSAMTWVLTRSVRPCFTPSFNDERRSQPTKPS
jgi:hypothetical protein